MLKVVNDKFLNIFRRREAVSPAAQFAPHLSLGWRGEALAATHLVRNGFRLVASNFKISIGRNRRNAIVNAEIDLIAYENTTLCFVEVKTRTSDIFAAPETAVDLRKQRQISRAARAYRRVFGLNDATYRFDVVSIVLEPNLEPDTAPSDAVPMCPRIELLRNFWTDAKFRKRYWHDVPEDV